MFEIRLADKPFEYKGKTVEDFYSHFILLVDGQITGMLTVDVLNSSLTKIDLDEPEIYYDTFIRAALNYFSMKGFGKVLLDGPDFAPFKKKYLLNGVFKGDVIDVEKLFSLGCGSA